MFAVKSGERPAGFWRWRSIWRLADRFQLALRIGQNKRSLRTPRLCEKPSFFQDRLLLRIQWLAMAFDGRVYVAREISIHRGG